MKYYPKIQSVYKRDNKTHKFIEGSFSLPEFEYLQSNQWAWTEKIDGTNISIRWNPYHTVPIKIRGRTENAQVPSYLLDKLFEKFPISVFAANYPETAITLFGEGYGAKIRGGGKYIPNGVDYILFDVEIDGWWLKREDIVDIASVLDINVVPIVAEGTLLEGVEAIKKRNLKSAWGDFLMEGLVLKPKVELKTRMGNRVITKLKHTDF